MDSSSIVSRNDALMCAPVDREIVFLNQATDSYVALDEIGRRIWELLERPRRVAELVDLLCDEFDGASQEITSDLLAFLEELDGEGMVSVGDRGAG